MSQLKHWKGHLENKLHWNYWYWKIKLTWQKWKFNRRYGMKNGQRTNWLEVQQMVKHYIGGHNIKIFKPEVTKAWGQLFSNKEMTTFRFSTSISNFATRVQGKHGVYKWSLSSLFDPTAFIGLYHEGDVLRVLLHRGARLVFWCGGDVLWLQKHPLWQWLLKRVKIDHVCENKVEQDALKGMGFSARIHPILFFDDWTKYPVSFKPSKTPHVWLTAHEGREHEYGVNKVWEICSKVPEVTFHIFGITAPDEGMGAFPKNIIYHGQVPSEELDEMIKGYHAGLRTCEFDGCPHTVTKGVLLGQYPINRIPYPHTDSYKTTKELIKLLKKLKHKEKPNLAGRKHWIDVISQYPWQ